MIIEMPEYVSKEDVEFIRENIRPFIKNRTYTYNREGSTIQVTKTPELKHVDDKLHAIFTSVYGNTIAPRFKPALASGDSGYEYHLYYPGDICHYHVDTEIAQNSDRSGFDLRYATVILNLNTIETGGELVFPAQNKIIKAEAGKITVFPPYGMFGHYTTPAEIDREIVLVWFVYKSVSVTINQESGIYASR
jgi:hypothetical protein